MKRNQVRQRTGVKGKRNSAEAEAKGSGNTGERVLRDVDRCGVSLRPEPAVEFQAPSKALSVFVFVVFFLMRTLQTVCASGPT